MTDRRVIQPVPTALLLLVGLLAAASVHAQGPPSAVEYYHLDALGSVRVVTNQAGAVVSRHDLMPFGEEWQPVTLGREALLFTGKERDYDTGLDYFGARYLKAEVGRFTTVDPVETTAENLVDPQRWNRYAYARNGPLRWTDPTGATIKVSGNDEERDWLKKQAVEYIGAEAGQYLQINWNKDLASWEFQIVGIGAKEFGAMNEAASDLGQVIGDARSVTMKVSSEALPRGDAGYTFDIGKRGANTEPVIVFNRSRDGGFATFGRNPLTSKLFGYRIADPMTWGIVMGHELGHAWGNVNGRRTATGQTAQEALEWENRARVRKWGPDTPRRIIH